MRARFCATVAVNGSVSAVGTHTGAAPWQPLDSMGAVENDPPLYAGHGLAMGAAGAEADPVRPSDPRPAVRACWFCAAVALNWVGVSGGNIVWVAAAAGGGGPQYIF